MDKKLKVGDYFTDDGRTFKVEAVNADGTYTSRFVGFEEVKPSKTKKEEITEQEVKDDPVPEKKYLKSDINRLNVFELEQLCETLDIPKGTGKAMKKAIIEKLGL
jgi:hypothetical protein